MQKLVASVNEQGRSLAFAMVLATSGLGGTAVVLANTLKLEACHLCIFQRLAYFVIAAFLLVAFVGWSRLFVRTTALVAASGMCLWGVLVAAQQSWLQWFPDSGLNCNIGNPGYTERLIDWLSQLSPMIFMATGFCGNKDLVVAGLSLANWSFLILLLFFVASLGLAMLCALQNSSHNQIEREPAYSDRKTCPLN